MFFQAGTSLERIQKWITNQYVAVGDQKNGYDVELRPHKKQRTMQQNKFFMAIMVAIVRFYQNTGFMPTGLSPWAMRTDILKEFYKARFGVTSTAKLDTKAFGEFIDNIQRTLVEESGGEWEVLEPDSDYLTSLINDME